MEIKFDSTDLKSMTQLMDEYGNSTEMFFGKTENDEDIHISIFPDRIVTVVYQNNHWVRQNIYYRNGDKEEAFDGRW